MGGTLAPEVQADIEKMAKHFHDISRFEAVFIDALVPWADFKGEPNPGHDAVADLLACKALLAGITTNFDPLVEEAASNLGERDFRPIVEQNDLASERAHAPFLKLHGCMNRNRHQTVWHRDQVLGPPIADRMKRFREWLAANLVGRDLLFIGFWTDWAYLTDLLAENLTAISPQHVYLVDPLPADDLKTKAPGLWNWVHRANIVFHHIAESGADFLDELRRLWSRLFLSQLLRAAGSTYQSLFGSASPAPTPAAHEALDSRALYALRRDLTGIPRTKPVRAKTPDDANYIAAAIHHRLLESGAVYSEHQYSFGGRRLRLLSGRGRVLSAAKADFQHEPPIPMVESVICAGAHADPSPAHIVRAVGSPTIVRAGSHVHWTTHHDLVLQLGGAHV